MSATASCHFPFLDEWKDICEKNRICEFVDSVISGYAQIAFNDNTFSGVLLIIATWIGSPLQCAMAVWATFVCTLCAYLIRVPKDLIRSGLYGFNAALSGLAIPLVLFPEQNFSFYMFGATTVAAVMCVFLTTFLRNFFGKWNVPALSAPYCAAVFMLVLFATFNGASDTSSISINTLFFTTSLENWTLPEMISAVFNGAAQVLWVEKPICGILYLIALLPASRIDASNAIIATVVSTTMAIVLGLPKDAVLIGLYGFNSILLMEVFSRGFLFSARSYLLNLIAAAFTPILCVVFKVILAPLGLGSVLAFPYVTICILVFLCRGKLKGFTYVPGKYWGVPETIYKSFFH